MPCGKEMPQETFLFTLKCPMRFSVSSHGLRRTFHLLDVRYPQVYRTQPLGASRKLTGGYAGVNRKKNRDARQIFVGLTTGRDDR